MISSKDIYDGFILHVKEDKIMLPDGREVKRELIRHIGAVCVIPVDEDRLEAAKRELREETGYTADNWKDLGEYIPAPAYSVHEGCKIFTRQ